MRLDLGLRLRQGLQSAADGPFGNHATLADGLVSYWALDESSGTRADVVGSNDLTDNNTVLYANTGPQGVVASFAAASSEYLSGTAHSSFSGGTARTVALWFRAPDPGGVANPTIFGVQDSAGGADRRVQINIAGVSPNITLAAYGGGGALNTTTGGLLTAEKWYFLVYTYDGTTHKVYIDNSVVITDAGADSGSTAGLFFGNSAAGLWNGNMSRAGTWSVELAEAERISIYNAGLGKAYSDLTAAEKTGLVSYWNLDEASGNRADSHGSNTLTDNNTVTSVDNTHPVFGKAASFVAANNESLSKANFTNSTSFTFAGWFWNPALPSNETAIAIDGGAWANDYPITVYSAAGTTLAARSGDGSGSVLVENAGISTGAWHFVVAWIDDSDKKLRIQVDDAVAVASSALTGSVVTPTATLQFGDSPETTTNWNGMMAHLMYWSRVLTAQERTDLYAAGAGLFYGD